MDPMPFLFLGEGTFAPENGSEPVNRELRAGSEVRGRLAVPEEGQNPRYAPPLCETRFPFTLN
jgi:hypothetical protein